MEDFVPPGRKSWKGDIVGGPLSSVYLDASSFSLSSHRLVRNALAVRFFVRYSKIRRFPTNEALSENEFTSTISGQASVHEL